MIKPRVKICCISSIEEANMAVAAGASALGFVGPMPSGPGIITHELIHEIVKTVPPPIVTFLLTSETKAGNILKDYHKVNTSIIQIVDELENREYHLLRQKLPKVKLIQVIHVINEDSVKEAVEISKYVDAILLDSGNPNLPVKELGGTGRTHDWRLSKKIRDAIAIPVFLAGGLNKENVKEAIEIVQPFGVDLCSGVRKNGKLDQVKLTEFFRALEAI